MRQAAKAGVFSGEEGEFGVGRGRGEVGGCVRNAGTCGCEILVKMQFAIELLDDPMSERRLCHNCVNSLEIRTSDEWQRGGWRSKCRLPNDQTGGPDSGAGVALSVRRTFAAERGNDSHAHGNLSDDQRKTRQSPSGTRGPSRASRRFECPCDSRCARKSAFPEFGNNRLHRAGTSA